MRRILERVIAVANTIKILDLVGALIALFFAKNIIILITAPRICNFMPV